jgi:hypothetical protein
LLFLAKLCVITDGKLNHWMSIITAEMVVLAKNDIVIHFPDWRKK